MKVVVTNPPWPGEGYGARSNVRWPHRRGDKKLAFPIYLAYTNALLKKDGFESRGIDAIWEEWGINKFVDEMKKICPRVIFMEVSTPSIMWDLETAEKLKGEMPWCTIVFCGPHATHFHEKIITNYTFVDVCVRGEFERAASDICKAVMRKKKLSGVAGITFRDSRGKVIVNKNRPLEQNMDDMPYPDRKDFPIERYQQAFYSGKKTAIVISSRGCPFQCTYCLWPSTLTMRKYRSRDPIKVVDEVEYLIKKEKVDEIFFDDDEFTMDRQKVTVFCNEILKRDIRIKWHCMGRVNVVNQDVLSLMNRAGCYQIFYGFESGSEKILVNVKKGITKEQIRAAVKMTKKAGIVCGGSFIIGTPEESMETFKETIRFAKSLGAWLQFVLCSPFPGTPMYDEAKRKGLITAKSWADFDGCGDPIMKTNYLSQDELAGIIRKAYISYYTSPRVIAANIVSVRNYDQARRFARGAKSILSRLVYYKHG